MPRIRTGIHKIKSSIEHNASHTFCVLLAQSHAALVSTKTIVSQLITDLVSHLPAVQKPSLQGVTILTRASDLFVKATGLLQAHDFLGSIAYTAAAGLAIVLMTVFVIRHAIPSSVILNIPHPPACVDKHLSVNVYAYYESEGGFGNLEVPYHWAACAFIKPPLSTCRLQEVGVAATNLNTSITGMSIRAPLDGDMYPILLSQIKNGKDVGFYVGMKCQVGLFTFIHQDHFYFRRGLPWFKFSVGRRPLVLDPMRSFEERLRPRLAVFDFWA
ncbi:hypothetical protein PG997_013682 [Apiospora hydei]|uniref:Uncharacterized protein n=1 Tax=Apiospora hydei TaxID=1337664 RepID=A0ABR1V9I9_9PEZI